MGVVRSGAAGGAVCSDEGAPLCKESGSAIEVRDVSGSWGGLASRGAQGMEGGVVLRLVRVSRA